MTKSGNAIRSVSEQRAHRHTHDRNLYALCTRAHSISPLHLLPLRGSQPLISLPFCHSCLFFCFPFVVRAPFFLAFFSSHQMIKLSVWAFLNLYWKSIKNHSSPAINSQKTSLIIDVVVNLFIWTGRLHFIFFLLRYFSFHCRAFTSCSHPCRRHMDHGISDRALLFCCCRFVIMHWNKWRHNCMYINVFEMANKRYKL